MYCMNLTLDHQHYSKLQAVHNKPINTFLCLCFIIMVAENPTKIFWIIRVLSETVDLQNSLYSSIVYNFPMVLFR